MPIGHFNYYNPTRIIFGRDTIKELDNYLPNDRTFIICYSGESIKKKGIYHSIIKALGVRKYEDFCGIEANPDNDTLMRCVARCRVIGVDKVYLLAVGGGNVVDGVKFIAAASCYIGDPWDMVLYDSDSIKKAIPMSVILTMLGGGTESNPRLTIFYRKINRRESFSCQHCFPEISILDPDTLLSTPIDQIQNGVIDAFVHVCEQYVTDIQNSDCQDRYSEGILRSLVKNGELIMSEPKNYIARSNIMWGANQALNTLIYQGVRQDWATHCIAQELTQRFGFEHGQALAIIQPRLYELKLEEKKYKLAMLGEAVFDIQGGTEEERAKSTIVAIEDFYNRVMLINTKMSKLNCSQDKKWISSVVSKFEKKGIKLEENKNITHQEVKKILENSY